MGSPSRATGMETARKPAIQDKETDMVVTVVATMATGTEVTMAGTKEMMDRMEMPTAAEMETAEDLEILEDRVEILGDRVEILEDLTDRVEILEDLTVDLEENQVDLEEHQVVVDRTLVSLVDLDQVATRRDRAVALVVTLAAVAVTLAGLAVLWTVVSAM